MRFMQIDSFANKNDKLLPHLGNRHTTLARRLHPGVGQ
jgi:hypothetical protein